MPCYEISQEDQPMCDQSFIMEQENTCRPPSCEQCCVQPPVNANSFAEDDCEISYEMHPSCQPQIQSPMSYEYQPCEEAYDACDQRNQSHSDQYGPSSMPCEPYIPCSMPCQPFNTCQLPCNPCDIPAHPCSNDLCGSMCSPFKKRRYVQPLRRESCKPMIRYKAPSIPMANDTVYRQSFDCIDSKTAASCRMPPVRPFGQLRTSNGQFANETVTQLSYQPYCAVERTRPIFPYSPSLLGKGPMQGLTTQKHDFVPKFQYRRSKVIPLDNIKKGYGCTEKNTVNKMSFMKPDTCNYTRVVSCKPIITYKRPDSKKYKNFIGIYFNSLFAFSTNGI